MIGAQKMVIGAVAAGLVAAGAATTLTTSTSTVAPTPMLAAFSTPLDNGNGDHNRDRDNNRGRDNNRDRDDHRGWGRDHDNDHGRGWDGDRRRDGDWDGHPWRWWHDWGISADLCRDGGGHVVWDRHRCEGGRFDDFHIR